AVVCSSDLLFRGARGAAAAVPGGADARSGRARPAAGGGAAVCRARRRLVRERGAGPARRVPHLAPLTRERADGPRMVRLMRGVLAATVLVLVGCGPPVGVTRVSPRTVTRELTESALNSETASPFSQNVLRRWTRRERFRSDPEGALARLHELVVQGRGRDDTLFALAELSFAHAEGTRKRDYYLQSAVAAWAFLFPGRDLESPDEFDPRLRIAADLYNRGLTQALSSADGSVVDLRPGLYPLPFGQQLAVHFEPDALRGAG